MFSVQVLAICQYHIPGIMNINDGLVGRPSKLNKLVKLLVLMRRVMCSDQTVLRIRDVYPGSEFFHPGSRVKKIPGPGSRSASKNLIWDVIPNPDLDFLPIPDPEVFLPITDPGCRGQKGTGSGSATPPLSTELYGGAGPHNWDANLYKYCV